MTDKVQKIREEVEKIVNSINLFAPDEDGKNSSYEEGRLVVASQILQIIDSLQEEPVNDKLHEFEKEFFSIVNPYRNSHNYKGICVNLINWQQNLWRWLYWKENKKEPVSEDLMDAANNYCVNARKGYPRVMDETDMYICNAFKAGAKWQKEKDFQCVKKECERTGCCCDNDIAIEAAKRHPYYYASEMEAYANIGFKEGAMWQKQQDQSTIELAEDHAMLAGMEKMKEQMMKDAIERTVKVDAGGYPYIDCDGIELYDYENDKPLARKGQKAKVIIILED